MNLSGLTWAIAIIVAMAVTADSKAFAQSRPVQAVTTAGQPIMLTMGKGGLFETSAPFAKVSVTDDKIVEVTPQSDREFVVNPRGLGSTNVFVFDDKNKLVARLDVSVVSPITSPQALREEEPGAEVRVYNRIYDSHGALNRPATYRCDERNCQIATGSPQPAYVPPPAPSPQPGAPPESLNTP